MNDFSLGDVILNSWHSQSRETKPRSVIWASEIGKDPYDRFWKMKGEQPTNDPTARAHFKFFVGDAIESAIVMVLQRAGFTVEVQKSSEKCRIELPGMLPVEGRYDAILSSDGDWDRAIMEMNENPLPPHLSYVDKYANSVAGYCREKYPLGFDRQVFEIKTINSMMLKSKMNKGTMERDYFHYHMQLYTYLKYLQKDKGFIFYISKDDGVFHIEEVKVSQELEDAWISDVKTISEMVQNNIEPEFPPFVTLVDGKYKVNYAAVGSSYLTKYTGMEMDDVKADIESKVRRLNYKLKKEKDANK